MKLGNTFVTRFVLGVFIILSVQPFCAAEPVKSSEGNDNRHNIIRLKTLPELSVSECNGVLEGVSAPFVGMLGDVLVVAGGCNFPEKPAAEGGEKVFYRQIYILRNPLGKKPIWEKAGKLPTEAAYGVSITTPKGIVCIGGCHTNGSLNSVSLLKWTDDKSSIITKKLPSLPVTMDNMASGTDGKNIYIAGGNINGQAGNRCFVFHIEKEEWEELPAFPGEARVQPVGVVQNSAEESRFYILGGFQPPVLGEKGKIQTAGWAYSPRTKSWSSVSNIQPNGTPEPMALIGASSGVSGSHHVVCFGGVNRDRFQQAIDRSIMIREAVQIGNDSLTRELQKEQYDYMTQEREWYRFNGQLLIYHTVTDSWVTEGYFPEIALAGAAVVPYAGKWLIVNGESKPGIRSTGVYLLEIGTKTVFGWLNWTVLGLYLLGMLFLGYYFMKRAGSSDDFFKGGGRIPWWAAGISIYATMLSAITYMAIPAKAFATNWTYYAMLLTILVVSFPVIKYYLPFFRRLNITSAYEYLQRRFNYTTRLMASVLFIFFMVARTALVLYLPSLALTTVTGIDIYICIILMGIVTIAYCTMGGVEAVVWGDVIQGIILVGGAFFAAGYLIVNTDGGLGGFLDVALEHEKFKVFEWSFDCTKAVFWVTILGGLANNLISYTSDQTVIQRYLTTKDERSAGKGILMNGLMSVFISIVFYLIGTGLFTFFKSHPHELNYTLSNGDAVFPFFMMSQMPVGLAGLLIAAIFAATMSTISSNINSTATAFSMDIYKHIFPASNDRHILKVARWTCLVAGMVGTLLAVFMATWNILSLLDYFNSILGLLSSGLGGLFIMGIFFDRIDAKGALIGFIVGTATVFLLSIYSPVSFLLYGAIGIIVSVGVALIISLFSQEKREQKGLTWKQLKNKDC